MHAPAVLPSNEPVSLHKTSLVGKGTQLQIQHLKIPNLRVFLDRLREFLNAVNPRTRGVTIEDLACHKIQQFSAVQVGSMKCYASSSYYGKPRNDFVQAMYQKETWFARLLLVFTVTELDTTHPLVFIQHYDTAGKELVSPLYGLPHIKKTTDFSIIPCAWLQCLLPVKICWSVPDSFYVDVETELETEE